MLKSTSSTFSLVLLMDRSKAEQIKAHARAIAKLLYEETEATSPESLETFEGIEVALRSHILEHIGPELGEFFVKQQAAAEQGAAAGLKAPSEMSESRQNKRKS